MTQRGGDDTGRQAKRRVLGGSERFVMVTHLEYAQHRPENFFAVDAHVRRHLGKQRRGEKVRPCQVVDPLAATHQFRALFKAGGHVRQVLLQLPAVDHRANVGAGL
ncbi:hypothetical protein D3C80_1717590 [compost metagenome]